MTPEERANDAIGIFRPKFIFKNPVILAAVADAIKEAEQDAYERAAALCEAGWSHGRGSGSSPASAAAIRRELKKAGQLPKEPAG